ncbi:tyrosine-type recombinase/integrase [Bacillus sp. A301a_S52]|jgi:site-specific recombinase XerD|nr:tyrosine-type recombinase/integrase [Bacillus sp. A301a_S52]
MTKRKESLHVNTDLSSVFHRVPTPNKTPDGFPIDRALELILRQMRSAGFRDRTMSDYELHVSHFADTTGAKTLEELTTEHVYDWLSAMHVSNQTKLTRLKCLKAFLSKCLNNGWLDRPFWAQVHVKVDMPVKRGVTEREINVLLTMLDLTRFLELRDATAILTMYQTGIRISTLAQLRESHVDVAAGVLKIDGGLLKNHQAIFLPFKKNELEFRR